MTFFAVETNGLTCYRCYDPFKGTCNWDKFDNSTKTCTSIQMYCVIQTGEKNNSNDVQERSCASRYQLRTSGYRTTIGCQRSKLNTHGKAYICIGNNCNDGTFEGHCEGGNRTSSASVRLGNSSWSWTLLVFICNFRKI